VDTEKIIIYSTAKKRNISDVDSDHEGEIPMKKSQQPPPASQGRGTGQRQRQRQSSALPITPPKGPRKRTNERPGLIVKKRRRTKDEIAAEKAAKEAKAKAMAAARDNAVRGLANMELDQEHDEAMRRQHVLRHQPSFLDVAASVAASSSGEDFDWGSVDNVKETDEMDVDSDSTDSGGSNPSESESADKHAATVKGKKVSTNDIHLIGVNNQPYINRHRSPRGSCLPKSLSRRTQCDRRRAWPVWVTGECW
jgi:hypothetical protein